jgi:hypothetical protein
MNDDTSAPQSGAPQSGVPQSGVPQSGVPQRAAQQVAAAVALARSVLPQLASDPEGHALAVQALAEAARWAAGEPVTADELATFLMDDRELGLITLEQFAPDETVVRALLVLQTAVALAAWHAARRAGRFPPALVSEVDEDTLDDLLYPQARDAGISAQAVAALRRHVEDLPPSEVADVAQLEAVIRTQ